MLCFIKYKCYEFFYTFNSIILFTIKNKLKKFTKGYKNKCFYGKIISVFLYSLFYILFAAIYYIIINMVYFTLGGIFSADA